MNYKKIYVVQIIVILVVLLSICIVKLYEANPQQKIFEEYLKENKTYKNYSPEKEYYDYDSNYFEKIKDAKFDKNGIILSEYNNNLEYIPSTIAYYGLMQYSRFIETNNTEYFDIAKKQADYLVSIQNKDDGGFYYNFDSSKIPGTNYKLKKGWISASGQAQTISLLCRIYYVSHDDTYKNASELALKPFSKEVKNGGVVAKFFDYDFYEEFPTEVPNYSLCGYLYSLVGFYDCYNIIENEKTKSLYDNGVKTLIIVLPYFDEGGYGYYNLSFLKNEENKGCHIPEYHCKAIEQLKLINSKENNEVIEYFIRRWEKFVSNNA